MKYILVTGASTGIGKDIAEFLIEKEYFVFANVRNQESAEKLKVLGKNLHPLIFDITKEDTVEKAKQEVKCIIQDNYLDALINNAGIPIGGPLMHIPIEELRYQFEVNVFGQVLVTQKFLPLLGAEIPQKHNPGKIINMSSIGGKVTTPFVAPYNASKYALESISDALRRELVIYGIDVIVVEPGAIKTPIWEKNKNILTEKYNDTHYKEPLHNLQKAMYKLSNTGLPVRSVSKLIWKILKKDKPKARYALPDKPLEWKIVRTLPDKMLDKAMCKMIGIKRRKE